MEETVVRADPRVRATAVVWILCSASFMAMLDVFVVNVAFGQIGESYRGSSLANLSWVLNGYAIAYAALLIPAGRLSDRLGRKNGFLIGLAVFTLASALCAVAPTLWLLVAFRVLQAVGAAVLTPAALGLMLTVLPPERVSGAVKIWATTSSVAGALGPVVGGALAEVSWRLVFVINIPVGIAAGIAALRMIPDLRQRSGARMPDLAGVALLIAALGTLSLGLVESGAWTGAAVWTALGVSAILLALFVIRVRRHADPVVPPQLFRVRSFVWADVTVLAFCTAFGASFLSMVLWLQNVAGYGALEAGFAIAPGPLMVPPFAAVGQWLVRRLPVNAVVALGNLLFAAGTLLLIVDSGTPVRYARDVLPGWMIIGAGIGLTLPNLIATAVAELPADLSATGSAVVNTARQLGYVLGVAILIAVFAAAADPIAGFRHGWWFITATAVFGAVTAVGVRARA
ncbi:Tetracenomycin C resistance and export protein [Nocardia seriolae]|uniref:Tetracenomycin C resistance and export protein n=1 Tax=Nocardia seriolae TaxID=37332 RepID=A0ABC8B137_9NOCA|nr:MFS transporter [Nocardia seriolae]APB00196.1 Tetracenomycin C resistance and export protein [Nocardia seriolae]